jgi:hypothetical protein
MPLQATDSFPPTGFFPPICPGADGCPTIGSTAQLLESQQGNSCSGSLIFALT